MQKPIHRMTIVSIIDHFCIMQHGHGNSEPLTKRSKVCNFPAPVNFKEHLIAMVLEFDKPSLKVIIGSLVLFLIKVGQNVGKMHVKALQIT